MITSLKLEVFCSLAETLSFTLTAQNMFMSQQTVSRLISELEDEIGVRLFDRSSRVVSLTKAGRRYHSFVVEMLWMHKNILHDISEKRSNNGVINIDVQMNLEIGEAPKAAMRLTKEQNPPFYASSSRISPNFLKDRLLTKRSDVAFILDRFVSEDPRIASQKILDTEYLLVTHENQVRENIEDTLESLKSQFILYDALEAESPSSCALRCQKELSFLELNPPEIVWKPNADSAFATAELGEGGYVISSSRDRIGYGRNLVGIPTGRIGQIIIMWRAGDVNPLVKSYVAFVNSFCKKDRRKFKPATEPFYYKHL